MKLSPALYLVSTPIGAADDITLKALDILRNADLLTAEDTRQARKLMDIHGVPLRERSLLAYHDHNGAQMRPRILQAIADGKSVAYVSDAGTPLVADPGYRLASDVIGAGETVFSAPGASAMLAALSVSGLPSDRFLFAGFLPTKAGQRADVLAELGTVRATLIFYESPKRLKKTLSAMAEVLGESRSAVVCRELTKKFEEVVRGTIGSLIDHYGSLPDPKGEIVLLLGPPLKPVITDALIDAALQKRLGDQSVKDSVAKVCDELNVPRKRVYQRALALSDQS